MSDPTDTKAVKLTSGFQRAIPVGNEYLGVGVSSYNGRVGLSLRFLWLPKDSDTLAPSKKGIFIPFEAVGLVQEQIKEVMKDVNLSSVILGQ
jgi:hypothetical protein